MDCLGRLSALGMAAHWASGKLGAAELLLLEEEGAAEALADEGAISPNGRRA